MTTQQLKKFKVLLIGDSCVDEYYIGSCDRLSPEAPVPVIKIVESYSTAGMAANVRDNLTNLGVEVDFVTNKERIVKTRYIDSRSRQHLLRVDSEPAVEPFSSDLNLIDYNAVVISDYNKGFLDYEQIEKIIANFSGPVFIDTKKTDLKRFKGAFIKINELEFKNKISKNDRLIVTMGSKGAVLKIGNKDKLFPTKAADVVDVCGCGDTFLAAMTYQYLMTNSIQDAIIFANKASSLTVQREGNYAPTIEEITNA